MVSYFNCSRRLKGKIDALAGDLGVILTGNLVGVYLHGSLAMGCFNPRRSDIDLLAVTQGIIAPTVRRGVVARLLGVSGPGFPLEISFVTAAELATAEFPLPYELHFSEAWRRRYIEHSADTEWAVWRSSQLTDPDLAAHIRVIKSRGIKLSGSDINTVFPVVSDAEYIAAIRYDLADAATGITARPVYFILNLCRFYGFLLTGAVLSKKEGGRLVRPCLSLGAAATVNKALRVYAGDCPADCFAPSETDAVRAELEERINELLCNRKG